MEIGIDVLDVKRMEELSEKETFLKKFFTQKEINFVKKSKNKAQVLAGYYSCKEAFLKALGIGIGRGIDLKEIEVYYDELGKPHLKLSDEAIKKFNSMGFNQISISISDSTSIAVATCLVY